MWRVMAERTEPATLYRLVAPCARCAVAPSGHRREEWSEEISDLVGEKGAASYLGDFCGDGF